MKIKKHKIIIPLLIILIAVYSAKGALYPEGTLISKLSLLLIFILSVFYFVNILINSNNKNIFFIMITMLLFVNIISYIFTANYSSPAQFSQFAGVLMALLPFYPFYFFSQKGYLKSKYLVIIFLLIIPIAIADFYYNREQVLSEKRPGTTDITNNAAYTFVFLIPYIYLINKKKAYSFLSIFIVMIFILMGAKRGAIVSGATGLIFLTYYQFQIIDKRNKLKAYIIMLIFLSLMAYFAYDYYLQNEYLIKRMESMSEGNSSGRDIIYTNLFSAWYNSNDFNILFFGRGFSKTLQYSGTGHFAHNDWLELLTNFGLLGVIIYLTMFYFAFIFAFNKNIAFKKKMMMMSILAIWFSTTIFSMNYTSSNAMFQNILLAYLLSDFKIISFGVKKKTESKLYCIDI